MRIVMVALFAFCASAVCAADDDKLDDKFLVGKWAMADVLKNPKKKSPLNNISTGTIEFRDDGTYLWKNDPLEYKGTYVLKGTTLVLNRDNKQFQEWKGLTVKDGKIYYPVSKETDSIFTRVPEKK